MLVIRKMLMAGGVAALATALAASAGAREPSSVQGWELGSTDTTCTMTSSFSDDVMIGLVWSPATSQLGFLTSVPKSLGVKGGKAVVALSFDGDGPYRDWEDDRAAVIEQDGNVALVASWGAEHSQELAKTVAAASRVSVSVDGRAVGSYDLAGSPAAYEALMRCGKQLAPEQASR